MNGYLGLDHQIRCVKREVYLRERVYPAFIRQGRLTETEADYQLRAMRSVLKTLEAVARDGNFPFELEG